MFLLCITFHHYCRFYFSFSHNSQATPACLPLEKWKRKYLFFDQVGLRQCSGTAQAWPRRLLIFHFQKAAPWQTGNPCYMDALPARSARNFSLICINSGGGSLPTKWPRPCITTCKIALAAGGPHYASRPVHALPPSSKCFKLHRTRKGENRARHIFSSV